MIDWIYNIDPKYITILGIFMIAGIVSSIKKFVFRKIIKKIVENTPTKWDDEFYPLASRLTSICIWVSAGILAMDTLGISASAIWTMIGGCSIVIGYGCKDTLSNIVAGLVILTDKPFKVGDIIELPSKEKVEVLKIGLRRSQFVDMQEKQEDSKIIIVPNVDLAKNKIYNYTYYLDFVEKGNS